MKQCCLSEQQGITSKDRSACPEETTLCVPGTSSRSYIATPLTSERDMESNEDRCLVEVEGRHSSLNCCPEDHRMGQGAVQM